MGELTLIASVLVVGGNQATNDEEQDNDSAHAPPHCTFRKKEKNSDTVKKNKKRAKHYGGHSRLGRENGAKEIRNSRESRDPQENEIYCDTRYDYCDYYLKE